MASRERVLALFSACRERAARHQAGRIVTALYLMDFLDRLRAEGFPPAWQERLERELTDLVSSLPRLLGYLDLPPAAAAPAGPDGSLEQRTGEVYFQLWKDFTREEYVRQTLANLRERFTKNGVAVDGVPAALDAGCGGGRYTLALRALGCRAVVGVDVSVKALALGRSKSPYPENEVRFVQGSVLELPFADASFDLVFSNGVLHHTRSTEQGLAEIRRVLKPGGGVWLYLYGGRDAFFWDAVDFARSLLAGVPQEDCQGLMRSLGYPPGRVFHRADFFYVPVNRRYLAAEVEQLVGAAGFASWRRLRRGTAHDWDEILFTHPGIDPYLYGEGEMRYWLTG